MTLLKLVLGLCVFLSSPHLYAAHFHFDTTSLGQVRDDKNGNQEIPFNEYQGMKLTFSPYQFSFEENLRYIHDFSREFDDFDLYQAVIHIEPVKTVGLDFGRQFINQGFYAPTLDGIQMRVTPKGHIEAALYAGIPRTVELGDFNKDDGMMAGFSLGLKDVSRTQARFHTSFRRSEINLADWEQNDQLRIGTDFSYEFKAKSNPLLYTLAEYDVTGTNFDTGTVGLDIYPIKRLALNFEFNYFNTNRDTRELTILSLFTAGETLSGRFATTATLVKDFLDFIGTYSFQRIEIQNDTRRNGNLLQTALHFSFEKIGLSLEPAFYYSNSFGGNVGGGRLDIIEEFTEKIFLEASVDYSRYNKITGNDDSAFSFVALSGFRVLKGLTLSAGAEYNVNNLFNRDVRGTFQISYEFDHKI